MLLYVFLSVRVFKTAAEVLHRQQTLRLKSQRAILAAISVEVFAGLYTYSCFRHKYVLMYPFNVQGNAFAGSNDLEIMESDAYVASLTGVSSLAPEGAEAADGIHRSGSANTFGLGMNNVVRIDGL